MLLLGNLDSRSNAGLSYLQLNNGLDNANWNIGGRAYGRIFFNVNKALYRSKVILFYRRNP